jgi:ubiquinone/menaquinone biosynthesis C-methylase UbiE
MQNSKNTAAYNKINQAYSSDPWWYDLRGFLILTFAYRTSLLSQIKLFSENMKSDHLEIAVGSGSLLKIILWYRQLNKKDKCRIIAFDYSERMLAGAIRKLSKKENVQFLLADAANMPFSDNSFDSINIANAIHSLPDIEKSFSEIFRVLKKNGTFVGNVLLYPKGHTILDRISTFINNWGIQKGILHRPYFKEEITTLLNQYRFNLISIKNSGNSLDFIATKN